MAVTDRRAETARQTNRDREQDRTERKQSRETKTPATQALEALINGGSWEQLPAEGVLSLSHTVGNDALLDVLALRETSPETGFSPPRGGGFSGVPLEAGGGEPAELAAPGFGGMSPLGAAAPVEI